MAELEFWSVRAVNWCEMRSLAQAPHPNDAYLNAPLGQGAMDGVGFVLVLDVGGRSQPPAAGDESRRRGASVGESDKPVVQANDRDCRTRIMSFILCPCAQHLQ